MTMSHMDFSPQRIEKRMAALVVLRVLTLLESRGPQVLDGRAVTPQRLQVRGGLAKENNQQHSILTINFSMG